MTNCPRLSLNLIIHTMDKLKHECHLGFATSINQSQTMQYELGQYNAGLRQIVQISIGAAAAQEVTRGWYDASIYFS